jgi:hypothetical protein
MWIINSQNGDPRNRRILPGSVEKCWEALTITNPMFKVSGPLGGGYSHELHTAQLRRKAPEAGG